MSFRPKNKLNSDTADGPDWQKFRDRPKYSNIEQKDRPKFKSKSKSDHFRRNKYSNTKSNSTYKGHKKDQLKWVNPNFKHHRNSKSNYINPWQTRNDRNGNNSYQSHQKNFNEKIPQLLDIDPFHGSDINNFINFQNFNYDLLQFQSFDDVQNDGTCENPTSPEAAVPNDKTNENTASTSTVTTDSPNLIPYKPLSLISLVPLSQLIEPTTSPISIYNNDNENLEEYSINNDNKDVLRTLIQHHENSDETQEPTTSSMHLENRNEVIKCNPDEVTNKLVNQVANMDKNTIKNMINNPLMKFDAALKVHARKKLREQIRKQLKTMNFQDLDKRISNHFEVDACIDSEDLPERTLIEISKALNINLFGDNTDKRNDNNNIISEITTCTPSNDINSENIMENQKELNETCIDIKPKIDLMTRLKNFEFIKSISKENSTKNKDSCDIIVLSDSSSSDSDDSSTNDDASSSRSMKRTPKRRRKMLEEKVVDSFKNVILPNVPAKERKQYEIKENSNLTDALCNIYDICVSKMDENKKLSKDNSESVKQDLKENASDEQAVQFLVKNIQNLFEKNKSPIEQHAKDDDIKLVQKKKYNRTTKSNKDNNCRNSPSTKGDSETISENHDSNQTNSSRKRSRNEKEKGNHQPKTNPSKSEDRKKPSSKVKKSELEKKTTNKFKEDCENDQRKGATPKTNRNKSTSKDDKTLRKKNEKPEKRECEKETDSSIRLEENSNQAKLLAASNYTKNNDSNHSDTTKSKNTKELSSTKTSIKQKENNRREKVDGGKGTDMLKLQRTEIDPQNKISPTKSNPVSPTEKRKASANEKVSEGIKSAQSAGLSNTTKNLSEDNDIVNGGSKSNTSTIPSVVTGEKTTLNIGVCNNPSDSSISINTFSSSPTADRLEGVNQTRTLTESNKSKSSSKRRNQQSHELSSFNGGSGIESIEIASKDNHLDHSSVNESEAKSVVMDKVTENISTTTVCVNEENELINLDPLINNRTPDRKKQKRDDINNKVSQYHIEDNLHNENKPRTWKSPGEKKCLMEPVLSATSDASITLEVPVVSPSNPNQPLTPDCADNNKTNNRVSTPILQKIQIDNLQFLNGNKTFSNEYNINPSSTDTNSLPHLMNPFEINQNDTLRILSLIQQNKISDAVLNNLKEVDFKLMELHKQKMYIEEMILKLQKDKMSIDVATMQLQNEKYLTINSILGNTNFSLPFTNVPNVNTQLPFMNILGNPSNFQQNLFSHQSNNFNLSSFTTSNNARQMKQSKRSLKKQKRQQQKAVKNLEFANKLKNRKKRCQRDILVEDAANTLFKNDDKSKLSQNSDNIFNMPSRRSMSITITSPAPSTSAENILKPNDNTPSCESIKSNSQTIKTENDFCPNSDSCSEIQQENSIKDRSPNKNSNSSTHVKECKIMLEKIDSPPNQHILSSPSDTDEHLMLSENLSDDENEIDLEDSTMKILHNSNIPNGSFEGFKLPIIWLKVIDKYLIAASEDGIIYKFNLLTHDLESVFSKHTESVTEIKTVKNNFIYSISLDGYMKKTSIENFGLELQSVNLQEPLQSIDLEWSTAFIGSRWGNVFTYNVKTNKLSEALLCSLGSSIMAIKATKEGPRKVLIVSSKGNQINLRDATSGLLLRIICIPKDINVYNVLMSGGLVYCGSNKNEIYVYDFTSGTKVATYTCGNGAVSMKLFKENLLFVGCYDGFVYVINKSTGAQLGRFPGSGKVVLALDIIAEKLITSSRDNQLEVIDIPNYILALVK